MAEVSAYLDFWRNAPRSTFESFRDCAVNLIEITAVVHARAYGKSYNGGVEGDMQVWFAVADLDPILTENLLMAKEMWRDTPLHRYLTRTEPVRVSDLSAKKSRYDGCCFHEVAINFGDDLRAGIDDEKATCRDYCAALRFHTARGDLVTDYLKSLVADIRCECAAGIERWQKEKDEKEVPRQPTSANEKNGSKFFPGGVPDDSNLVDLAVRLDAAKGNGKTQLEVAREFTGETLGNDTKAKRLLARLRMMKTRGKFNL